MSPFRIAVPEERLAAIRERVAGYDWSLLPDAGGWGSGVGLADLRRLCDFWLERYDWRATEERLNALPQVLVEVDGVPVHAIHVRGSGAASAPPVLLLHGWPGSVVELEALVAPLAAAGHDVVVPSLPGFGFSTPLREVVGPRRIAALLHRLMTALVGDTAYVVHGGDWGSGIGAWLAHDQPASVAGLHLTMVMLQVADVEPETDEERAQAAAQAKGMWEETGYLHQQSTRPQTLGAAPADSPVGLAAWIVEKFGAWGDLPRDGDGTPDLWAGFTEEQLLDNLMLHLGPPAAVSSTWIYQGHRREQRESRGLPGRIEVPTGVAAFRDPVYRLPARSLVERSYDVVRWRDMPAGGHFPGFEQPGLLVEELLAFVGEVS